MVTAMDSREPEGVFTGGINTTEDEAANLAKNIGLQTGLWIRLRHNPTGGILLDLGECLWNRYMGAHWPTEKTKALSAYIRRLLKSRKVGNVYFFAHSQGCMQLMNALNRLTPKEKSRCVVFLFAVTNLYQTPGLRKCEYFLNDEDYVVSNLILGSILSRLWRRVGRWWSHKKNNRGKLYVRRGGGHALQESYLDVLPEFSGFNDTDLKKLIEGGRP